jgi:hypothetical protein
MKEQYSKSAPRDQSFANQPGPTDQGTKVNGLQQVVDLLRSADPAFRESLIKRLTQRDPQLAMNLRKYFANQR